MALLVLRVIGMPNRRGAVAAVNDPIGKAPIRNSESAITPA